MTNMFNVSQNTHYSLRSNEIDFDIQKPNTNLMKKSTSFSGAMLWNDLPKLEKESIFPLYGLIATIVHRTIFKYDTKYLYNCYVSSL